MAQPALSLWVAVASGLLAVASIGAKGVADVRLERAKLDSQLIIDALGSPSIEARRNSLQLLVEAGLVSNKNTAEGLKKYFEGSSQLNPPQFFSSRSSAGAAEEYSDKTDVDLFICDSQSRNKDAMRLREAIRKAVDASNQFGRVRLKNWSGVLYDEIPQRELEGKVTLVFDLNHDEVKEEQALRNALALVPGLPTVKVLENQGETTAWLVSVVLCPEVR